MMRLSANPSSPLYDAALLARKPIVFLNGERIDLVVEADEDNGRVVVYEANRAGRKYVEYDDVLTGGTVVSTAIPCQEFLPDGTKRYVNPRVVTRELHGVVKIELEVAA